jgi:SOS-response transcriptional repressor LexA
MAKRVNTNLSHFANRVSNFRLARGWTQERLAHEMGISRNYICMIEGGRLPRASVVKLFESLESAPVYHGSAELAAQNGDDDPTLPGIDARPGRSGGRAHRPRTRELSARYVPLITWAQAGELADVADLYPHAAVHSAFDAQDARAFAVTITGDAMEPPFAPGDVAIVYPSRAAANGNLVLARTREGEVFFKRLTILRAGEYRFSSYNAVYPAFDRAAGELAWIFPVASVHKATL